MKTILVVDDDAVLRTCLEEFLTDEGYNVYAAADTSLAKHIITGVPVDLLLSDVDMPEGTGPDLAAWVNEHHPNEFPIVFMSGGPAIDGYPFLPKPFALDHLRGALKKALKEEA